MKPYVPDELTRSYSSRWVRVSTVTSLTQDNPGCIPGGRDCGSQWVFPARLRRVRLVEGIPRTKALPSENSTSPTAASRKCAAISRNLSFNPSAALYTAAAPVAAKRLEYPPVAIVQFRVVVSIPATTLTSDGSIPSTSATICAATVSCPCP